MIDRTTESPGREGDLLQFFLITFAFSWALWLLPLLRSNGLPNLPEPVGILGMLAPLGPGVAAFWLVGRQSGSTGVKELWMRAWRASFEKKWLVPALLIGPFVAVLTAVLVLASGETVDWASGVPPLMIVPIFLLIYLANALPEEFGWRGYALDPLQRRFSALTASLLLGLVWGLWHLPLFLIEGTTQAAIPMYEFLLQTMVLAVIYTWLYNNTGGSILIAALFHASANTAAAAVPAWTTELGRWVDFGLFVVVAAVVVRRWGWRRLSPKPQ